MTTATLTRPFRRISFFAALRKNWSGLSKSNTEETQIAGPFEAGISEVALSDMEPGEFGHVAALHGKPEVRQHLLELGFTSGTQVEFVRRAPLSDPLTIRIRGYLLSLRRSEADAIIVRRQVLEADSTFRSA